jgi:hypothetical protein
MTTCTCVVAADCIVQNINFHQITLLTAADVYIYIYKNRGVAEWSGEVISCCVCARGGGGVCNPVYEINCFEFTFYFVASVNYNASIRCVRDLLSQDSTLKNIPVTCSCSLRQD